MSFANPLFLYGLFALAIPVLIHLFNFRRYTRVWFTNVRFLQELKQETQKRSRLKQWLLLAIRLLTIASIVMAFSQPYIPSRIQHLSLSSSQAVSMYLDNSFSMDAVGEEGKLLEQARKKAKEIAGGYMPSDRFQLLTNDFDPRHQRLVSREEFLQALEEVDLSPTLRNLSAVIARQQDLLSTVPDLNHTIYSISDFQQSTCDLDQLQPDSTTVYYFLPLMPVVTSNLFIDTVFFESSVQQPDHLSRLRARIRNTGSERIEKIPVKLMIEGTQRAIASIDLDPGSETEIVFPFRNDLLEWSSGYVELLDYPVVYDDKCYFSFPLITHIPILDMFDETRNPYVSALYDTDSAFRLEQVSIRQLDYASFPGYSLIILDQVNTLSSGLSQALVRYMTDGGDVLVILPKEMVQESYTGFFSETGIPLPGKPDTIPSRIASILVESPLFADVFEPDATGTVTIPENADLPDVSLHYPIPSHTQSEILLGLQNRDAFLLKKPVGKGTCYVLTSPLDLSATNFPGHLLFVPVFLRIAMLSQPFPHLYYPVGDNQPIELPHAQTNPEEIYRIGDPDNEMAIIPEIRILDERTLLYPHGQIQQAGIYALLSGQKPIAKLAFNYPRKESELTYWSAQTLKDKLGIYPHMQSTLLDAANPFLTNEIRNYSHGKPLWKFCLILALMFFAAETVIIHFFRRF